jgi:cell cycle sensor histidine kinase DivJ
MRPNPSEDAAALQEVMWWHAGWASALVLAAIVLLFNASHAGPLVWLALAAGMAPPAAAFALNAADSPRRRLVLLAFWAVMSVLACCLTGGVGGPLAVWCVAPLAAAAVLGGAKPLAQGASLTVGAFAVVGLAQAAGLTGPSPDGAASFDLALVALATISVGLAVALLLSRRRLAHRSEAQGSANADLHAVLLQQPHLIVTLDGSGRIAGAYGLPPAGVDPDRLFTLGLAALAPLEERVLVSEAIAEAMNEGHARVGFAPTPGAWLQIALRRMDHGRLVATLRDASDEHAREQALDAARIDAETLNIGKSRFLANMSHELRTPLNAIMGFSDIMRERMFGTLPGKYAEYADLIHDAGSHLLDLINDVLDMSKIEAAKYELSLEQLDVREPVQAALRLMRLQADDVGVQLRGVLPSQPLEAYLDRRAVKQIALNLLSNALKFTPRGGLVTVSVQALAGALELTVADTGMGISEKDLERLGRPFEQAGDASQQARGTGLGLSLVRAFAELHGGEMSIESRLGEGTAVTVRLPALAAEQPPPAEPERPSAQVIAFNPHR